MHLNNKVTFIKMNKIKIKGILFQLKIVRLILGRNYLFINTHKEKLRKSIAMFRFTEKIKQIVEKTVCLTRKS